MEWILTGKYTCRLSLCHELNIGISREYPVAPERGGNVADKKNYSTFLKNLRAALDASGTAARLGLSITIV